MYVKTRWAEEGLSGCVWVSGHSPAPFEYVEGSYIEIDLREYRRRPRTCLPVRLPLALRALSFDQVFYQNDDFSTLIPFCQVGKCIYAWTGRKSRGKNGGIKGQGRALCPDPRARRGRRSKGLPGFTACKTRSDEGFVCDTEGDI